MNLLPEEQLTVANYAKEITLKAMDRGLFSHQKTAEQNAQNVCKFYSIVFEEIQKHFEEA